MEVVGTDGTGKPMVSLTLADRERQRARGKTKNGTITKMCATTDVAGLVWTLGITKRTAGYLCLVFGAKNRLSKGETGNGGCVFVRQETPDDIPDVSTSEMRVS